MTTVVVAEPADPVTYASADEAARLTRVESEEADATTTHDARVARIAAQRRRDSALDSLASIFDQNGNSVWGNPNDIPGGGLVGAGRLPTGCMACGRG